MEHLRNYFQEVPPDISDAPSQPLDNGALLSVTPQSEVFFFRKAEKTRNHRPRTMETGA